jgi:hypothetical protein
MKLKRLAAVIGLGLLGASATAQAYQAWDFQDDSIEFILRENPAGGFTTVTGGPAQKGDIFVAIFEFTTASATPPGVSLIPPGKELTGVSVIQLDTDNPLTTPFWSFKPYTGGMNSILSLIGSSAPSVVGGNAGGGAVAAMWLNDANPANHAPSFAGDRNLRLDAADPVYGNTTNCTSLVDCLQQASLGTLFQVDGLWGVDQADRNDPDNFWKGTILLAGGGNYSTVKSGAKNTQFVSVAAGLSNLYNVVTPVLLQDIISGEPTGCGPLGALDNCVQATLTGQILGGAGLVNGAVGRNDIDGRKLVAVPEPATLGLLGLGLLGLGLLRRRQG